MIEEKIKLLKDYIKLGFSPILLEDISANIFENAVILEANCGISSLNGHYENINFIAPAWYNELIKKCEKAPSILIINQINKISQEEQLKFVEILKYKKISTFDLPNNCIIIVTCYNLKQKPINEEIYSLMVHI